MVLLAALATVVGLVVAAPAGAAPPDDPGRAGEVRQTHEEIVAYWTAQRIRTAIPRDIRVDPATGRIVPQAPGGNGKGKGGGGGGGDGDGPVDCTHPKNKKLPECQETPPDDGGGGEEPPPPGEPVPPAATDGTDWNVSGYDTADSDVRHITGKVLFSLGTSNYVCSGSVVEDAATGDGLALVLTAGHCVHEGSGGVTATNWMFFPDFDQDGDGSVWTCADSPHGCWTATSLVTTADWALVGNLNYDVGFAVLAAGGHDGATGLESVLTTTLGAAPAAVGFNRARGEFMTSFGYPQAAPYDGKDLVYCAGDSIPWDWWIEPLVLYTYHQGLSCTMTGGSSGGPWYAAFDTTTGTGIATSVNSFKYVGDDGTMYGTYFGNYAAATYAGARESGLDELVLVGAPAQLP